MWNDPHGWGIQVYPAASGADIYNNVIDKAGSGFVIGGGIDVSHNTIQHNIVTNSTGLRQAGLTRGVAISGCCGVGTDDSFADNISDHNPGGIGAAPGVALKHNSTFTPRSPTPRSTTTAPPARRSSVGICGTAGLIAAAAGPRR